MMAMPLTDGREMLARSIGYLIVVPAFTGAVRLANDRARDAEALRTAGNRRSS